MVKWLKKTTKQNNKNKPATFYPRKGENVAPCKIPLSIKAEEREEKPQTHLLRLSEQNRLCYIPERCSRVTHADAVLRNPVRRNVEGSKGSHTETNTANPPQSQGWRRGR